MKLSIVRAKLFLFAMTFVFVFASASVVLAQGQRIALLPFKIPLKLSPGQTRAVESVCLDSHLEAPVYDDVYKRVLSPSQGVKVVIGEGPKKVTLSLPEAIRQGVVEFRGLDYGTAQGALPDNSFLQLTNTDPKNRTISFQVTKSAVLHSEPGRFEELSVLKKLDELAANSPSSLYEKNIQEEAWAEMRAIKDRKLGIAMNLSDGGYLKALPEEGENVVLGPALRKFQQANALKITGKPDAPTLERLNQKAAERYGPLLRVITTDPLSVAKTDESLEAVVRRFQEDSGLPPSGKFDPATVVALRDEFQLLLDAEGSTLDAQLREYQRRHGLPEDGQLSPPVMTQLRNEQVGEELVYEAEEFNYVRNFRGAGSTKPPADRQVLAVHEVYSDSASGLSLPTEQHILIGSASGDIELRIVRRQSAGEAGLFGRYVADSTVLKNEAAIEAVDNQTRKLVVGKSDAKTNFAHAGAYQPTADNGRGAIQLQLGGQQINLSAAGHEALFNGDPKVSIPELDNYFATLPSGAAGDKMRFIIVRDAFAQGRFGHGGGRLNIESSKTEGPQQYGYHESRRHVHPTELASQLKARYGDKADFLLDDELDTGKANAASMPLVTKSSDIAAYVPPNDPLEKETSKNAQADAAKNIITNISDYLREAGVTVERGFAPSAKTNVLVLTGHKDREFVRYVNELGYSGVFKGHVVAMASCYEVGDEALNSRIVRSFGAKAVLFYDRRLNVNAVESVLFELTQLLKGENFSPARLDELLNRSIDKALEKLENAPLRSDMEKMRRSVIQVSQLELKCATTNHQG